MDVYILDEVGYEVTGGAASAYRTMLDAMRAAPCWGGWKYYVEHDVWCPTKYRPSYRDAWRTHNPIARDGMAIYKQTLDDPIKRPELRGGRDG